MKDLQTNNQIRDKQVRVIDEDGNQLGIMSAKDAYFKATSKNLDLVKVSPNAKPPVCKILDYGKYKYELEKKQKEAKKHQHTTKLKEIRFTVKTQDHDLETKAKKANKFLENGNRVKVSIRLRGREHNMVDDGKELLLKFFELVKEQGEIDKRPQKEGRFINMFVNPK